MAHKAYIFRRLKYKFGCYRKKKRKYHKLHISVFRIYFIIIILSSIILFIFSGQKIFSLSVRIGADRLENEVLNTCSQITAKLLAEQNISYPSIIETSVNEDGQITSLRTDFNMVNQLKTSLEQQLCEHFLTYNYIESSVPLGSVFSDDLFSTWGPDIPIGIICSADTSIEFTDSFTDAGLNQTKHTLVLDITVYAKLHTALTSTERTVKTSIPIAETVIVGDVPNFMVE